MLNKPSSQSQSINQPITVQTFIILECKRLEVMISSVNATTLGLIVKDNQSIFVVSCSYE